MNRLASICPLPALAGRLQARLGPMLSAASVFMSPRTYSRFVVSLLVLAAPLELLALVCVPLEQAGLIVCGLALMQLMPVVWLLSRSNARRRAVDAELPFLLMTLSVFSHEANPTLQDGLKRVAAMGAKVFPAFSKEGEILARDDAFVPGAPVAVAESSFERHPSARLTTFVHGFLKTLSTGKDVSEFVQHETSFQLQKLEQSWSSFGASMGSLAEVTFILLALFPVGLEMIGASVPGFSSSYLFFAAFGVLGMMAVFFLFLTDSIQPVAYDRPPRTLWLLASIAAWAIATVAFQARLLDAVGYVVVPLSVSVIGFYQTRKHHAIIRKGEEEVATMLHDISEESKAGVSLPEALSRLSSAADGYTSVKEPLLRFYQSIRLGLVPTEAQRRVSHPSWLVRMGFAMLSVAFDTGAGFEHLEELSSLFRRVVDARKSVSQSMITFLLVGAIVPVISVASISLLAGFAQQNVPVGIPLLAVHASESSLILSVSTVSLLSGLLLSKMLTQTVRHEAALPILMASTLVSLLAFGVV